MSSMKIVVATAEREVYSGEATMLLAPGSEGELGIMPGHNALLTSLNAGELIITNNDEVDEVFVAGGYMEVQPDKVTVLADVAERAADMDEAEIIAAQRKAEELIASKKEDIDFAAVEAEIAMMAARLRLLQKRKTR